MILVSQEKRAAFVAEGWWGTSTLWELFLDNVRERPEAEAVVDPPNRADFAHGFPRRLSWTQLADEVDRFCRLLVATGLRRDEVVVIQLPNCVEQLVIYLACARLGIIVTPVPIQYREHELESILGVTSAAAAITFARIGKADGGHRACAMFLGLRAQHPGLRLVMAWGDDVDSQAVDIAPAMRTKITADDACLLVRAEHEAGVTADDVFTICWTSGTEAQPKGVPRNHNEWLIVAPSIIESALLPRHARLLNPFPLVNMAGIATGLVTWLKLAGTLVQHQPFSLPVFLQQLREESVDYTIAPPAILNSLLQNDELLAGIDFRRLHRIGSGSAPLSEWMVRGFKEKHGVEIINYYGSNEGASLSGNQIDIPDPAQRAQFFPRAGVEGLHWSVSTTRKIRTRLMDLETGEEIVQPGRAGELRVAGPTIFNSYWGAPDQTAQAFDQDGYYRTGDLFEIAGNDLQFYRYVGRSKDLVIRGGVNISSEEIENLLLACPGVGDVAVVGVPDITLGEKLCACIVPAQGQTVTLEALKEFLRTQKRVAVYKLPEYLLTLDALPRNPVGKIVKRNLRELAKGLAPTPHQTVSA